MTRNPIAGWTLDASNRGRVCRMADNPEAHSPLPWEWDAGLVPPDGPERYADIYIDGGETIIARFNDHIPEGRANARLIVTAVNHHAALVEALRQLLSSADTLFENADTERARALLAAIASETKS